MQETAEQVTSAHLTSFILTDDGQSGGSVRRLKPERPVQTVPVVTLDGVAAGQQDEQLGGAADSRASTARR
jgi:hypothetical protein